MKQVVVLAPSWSGGRRPKTLRRQENYEAQQPGIGAYCVDSLLADIESLGLFSGIHPLHFGFHRMLSSRFPFAIYYREHGNEAQVFAVLDLRRNPNWIRKELRKRDG